MLFTVSNDSIPQVFADSVGTLKVGSGLGIPFAPAVMYPLDLRNAMRNPEQQGQGVGMGDEGDPAYTVTSSFVDEVALGYDEFNNQISEEMHHTLRAGTRQSTGVMMEMEVNVSPTLSASDNPSRSPQSSEVTAQVEAMVNATSVVRRLTPVECERLQGFPDDWTAGQADSHRYKQMGNAVTVNVATWVGKAIMEAENAEASDSTNT